MPAGFILRGYDLKQPTVIELPDILEEISGIFYAGKNSVFAICDDHGSLFKIDLNDPANPQRWRFDKKRDYEDLFMVNGQFYILNSNGNLYSFPAPPQEPITAEKHLFPFNNHEFEILFFDEQRKKLLLVCKHCRDIKDKDVPVYSFDPISNQFEQDPFLLDTQKIAASIGEGSIKFRPSAAVIKPGTRDVYMVSSVNKLLLVTGPRGGIKEIVRLDPQMFKQPEGISFTEHGSLIISNEAAGNGPANLLVFHRSENDGG